MLPGRTSQSNSLLLPRVYRFSEHFLMNPLQNKSPAKQNTFTFIVFLRESNLKVKKNYCPLPTYLSEHISFMCGWKSKSFLYNAFNTIVIGSMKEKLGRRYGTYKMSLSFYKLDL